MLRYKLTNEQGQTHGNTQWGEGITHTADGSGDLCSPGWIHVYTDPLLAVLLNPIHGNFYNPILWEVECTGQCKTDYGLKEGWTSITTVKRIPLPEVSLTQKIAFGILCVKQVYTEPLFLLWADNWLSGKDRSTEAAEAAEAEAARAARAARAAEAAAEAAEAAAQAARAARATRAAQAAQAARAARAAAEAAAAAGAAAEAAEAAAQAARAAASAAARAAALAAASAAASAAGKSLNLINLAKEVMNYVHVPVE